MNSNKLKVALIISLVFNLAVVAALVVGWHRRPHRDYRGRIHREVREEAWVRRARRLAHHLQLSDEKAERLDSIGGVHSEEVSEIRTQLRQARKELFSLFEQEEASDEDILQKVNEISELQSELEVQLVKKLIAIRSILSPEERERFLQLMKRHEHSRKHGPPRRFKPRYPNSGR
jgi:Spy/CpxP family protein refolding chaperone